MEYKNRNSETEDDNGSGVLSKDQIEQQIWNIIKRYNLWIMEEGRQNKGTESVSNKITEKIPKLRENHAHQLKKAHGILNRQDQKTWHIGTKTLEMHRQRKVN